MGGSSQASDMTETTGQGHMGQGFDQNQGNLGQGFDSTGALLTHACHKKDTHACRNKDSAVAEYARLPALFRHASACFAVLCCGAYLFC